MNRYSVGSAEGDFEPGSNDQVLKNKLGITSEGDMNDLELRLLQELYVNVVEAITPTQVFTVESLKTWHRRWLGNVYEWAGQERSVNMSKDGFPFAAAAQIPSALAKLEQSFLRRWTPCTELSSEELIEAIATTHVELILIHPFREGNGRISRLLADAMAVQAGRDPLDYSAWEQMKTDYIKAIHQGVVENYEPMKYFVRLALGEESRGITSPV